MAGRQLPSLQTRRRTVVTQEVRLSSLELINVLRAAGPSPNDDAEIELRTANGEVLGRLAPGPGTTLHITWKEESGDDTL